MRKTIIILVCCTVVLLLGYCGYRAYELWKQSHWMSLAKQFAARQDPTNERLCLAQVLRLDRSNLDANRMMANLAQAARSPAALTFREKVVELDPNSLSDRLALVQTAVLAADFATASNALAGVDTAGKKTSAYFNAAGELAFALHQIDEAKADFAQASRLDPDSLAPQLSLAGLELSGTNALDMAEARIMLKRISLNATNLEAATEAKRDLVADALRLKDNATALSLSKELAEQSNAVFSDKLLRLDVLRSTQSRQFDSALASCEQQAATNSATLSYLTLWLLERHMPSQALAWLRSLPARTQTTLPAALLEAECEISLQDWPGLQNTISKEDWGGLEYQRHAYLARALRQQGLYEASKAEWEVAVRSANNNLDNLTALCRFAALWNWQDEAQQILWNIVNNFPQAQAQWAARLLVQALYASGSTRPLMELFSIQVNRNPDNLDYKNDLALTAMLLRAQELNPYGLARDVYQKEPTNSFYACTYAFSLYLQGKNAAALKIMQQLTPQQLTNNATAGYYGIILNAAGDNAKAGVYLKRAVRGPLLPEERALFQQALSGH